MQASTYSLAAKLRARRVYEGNNGEAVVADTEVKLMQKLHQIYSGSVISESGTLLCFDHSKAKFISEHFKDKKIAVFYKFRAELEMLRWAFKANITESPEEFNARPDLTFVSQIQSGREGINLSSADALVFFNIDFSHVSYLQARARLQTMEREKAASLYWVFAEDGIEEKIYEKVKAKEDYQLSHFRRDYKVVEASKAA
jgi:SNF2 family DNA or RNA helicase